MFPSLVYRTGFAAVACAAFILLAPAGKAEEDVWPALKQQTFGDRQIQAEARALVEPDLVRPGHDQHPNSNGMQLNINTADIIPARASSRR